MSGWKTIKTRNRTIKTADIRSLFLDYFRRRDHKVIPSSPVIPFDDPTILFTNAGMNQFKDVFTGRQKPDHPRATSSQKCIRAGGKHNDLDNVGFTARHHTFFEMLGNFSFGDYFKEEAIAYAWEWVTKEAGFPSDRLYASVFEEDDEAFDLWAKIAPELKNGRIMRFGKKDNYWSMGDIGPCGPSSEIHFDRGEKYGVGPQHVVNGDTDRYCEIWNLVFMQYDQLPDGKVVPLPKPSVDTGAGLERLTATLMGAETNYGIDIFQALITVTGELTKTKYEGNCVASHQVIADHVRALSFAIADGAGISNEGQGYVLRRILRRAARHGHLLGMEEPFIYRLVPTLVGEMGQAYPELREKQSHIENVIKSEEESFGRTLDTGLELFDKVAKKLSATGQTVVPGDEVFKLYDTYGFPADLTEIIAADKGFTIDQAGFEKAMEQQKKQSRAGGNFGVGHDQTHQELIDKLEHEGLGGLPPTDFVRSESLKQPSQLLLGSAAGSAIAIVLDRTPFYVEAGGQVADVGAIISDTFSMNVTGTLSHREHIIHFGELTKGAADDIQESQSVTAEVDAERRWDIMRNHTATHLAHAALRNVLGEHIKQSGSYVGPDRLRFDFSHHQPLTQVEIEQVERIVNEQILLASDVNTEEMDVESAKTSGAMALFGEKYGDTVRVVSVPGFSKELCGGTHVTNTSQIGYFMITLETGIASGIRRMEAITGRAAQAHIADLKRFRNEVAATVGRPEAEALAAVRDNREQLKALEKEIKKVRAEMFSGGKQTVGIEQQLGRLKFVANDFGDTDRDTMSAWVDVSKGSAEAVVAVALGQVGGKRTFVSTASGSAVKDQGVHIGDVAKELLPQFGGRGGGKPSFAQGGVGDDVDADAFFEAIKKALSKE
ncbi:MAG: alanine--tRNA ligase [bacterium]